MSVVPAPAAHGGDGPAVARALGVEVLDLSVSLNPVAPDVTGVVGRHLDRVRSYPDPAAATEELAGALGVAPERLLLTNGGAEAIALLAAEVGGRVREPEFGLHPRGTDGPWWRSDPHNPTGRLAGPEETADVWDEAFYPLATGRWTGPGRDIVVGSLTKLFGCPGLRLGYLLADPDLVFRCRRRQPAWSVGSLALAALPDLLAAADLGAWARAVARFRVQLVDVLRRHGLAPAPSDACWVLVDAPGLRERLALAGVVVRDCASFGLPGVMRVAVPDEAGLSRLDEALRRCG